MLSNLRLPLRHLLLGLTLLGLLPLAALTAVSIYAAHQRHQADVQRATLDLARAVASAVDAELSASIGSLQVLASANELERCDLAAFHRELTRLAKVRPGVRQISVTDLDGRVILRSNAPPDAAPVQPVEPASLAKVIASGKPLVGSVAKGPLGEFAYPVRAPVFEAGRMRYVLTAAVLPQGLREILQRQNRPADWVITVIDSAGLRVARSRDHDSTVATQPSPSLRVLLANNPSAEGFGRTNASEGDEIITAFARMPSSGWIVAIGAPASLMEAGSGPTLALYALGVGGSLLVAIPLALALSRRIRRDIQLVVNKADTIGCAADDASAVPTIPELATLMRQVAQANRRVNDALDEAERAAGAKDQFLAVLGHELRNPLAPISSVLTLLDMKAGNTLVRERLILRRQVAHMTRLVDDLLDVARLVEGKVSLNREPVQLLQLVDHALESFREQEASAALQVHPASEPLLVDADPVRLTQVITNLLMNASRHGAGKPISIELRRHGEVAHLLVADQGEGMGAETLARVFEPFYQARSNPGSLGLGLAIVRSIVERHGGYVRATSAGPGLGSTFLVGLPLLGRQQEGL
ncbi:MAG TPA: sensor histidine kinase [Ramlibacter sp.]|nr:sensor histidine kinase [Ramlibacter sp.]